MKRSGKWRKIGILSLVLLVIAVVYVLSVEVDVASSYDSDAEQLKALNLFHGTELGFELDRSPTRMEGAVMLVRILGKEDEAKKSSYNHPFTDVPEWGAPYAGYLYQHKITTGITNTTYGSSEQMTAAQYITFVLRALDYSDAEGDFVWNEAVEKAVEIGLINSDIEDELLSGTFLRGHVAHISYNALHMPLKDETSLLADKLIADGAFTASQWELVKKDSAAAVGAVPDDDYTVLVYLNGSDLESTWYEEDESYSGAASADLEEMMNGIGGNKVNVVVETGGTLEWANNQISGEQNQRWLVEPNQLTKLADLGAKNMGKASTLADFVTWGIETYPAKKYALIFWDHGGGAVLGFGVDELFDSDSLTLDEIKDGLATAYKQTGTKLELVGFDACLMATVETAYLLSPYAKYLVASQELEPGHGWDYKGALRYLSSNSTAGGADLGKAILDTYEQHAIAFEQEQSITLSVTDLRKVPAVVQALEAFVKEAGAAVSTNDSEFYTLAQGRSRAEDYGSATEVGGITDMTDIASIARNVVASYPKTADALEAAIESAVVHNLNSKGRPDASGLSVYFPHKDKENFSANLAAYANIGFSDTYNRFLATYVKKLSGAGGEITIESSNHDEFEFTYGSDDSEVYEIQLNVDDLERIEQIFAVVAALTSGPDGPLVYLGYDHYVDIDWETGLLRDDFNGEWLTWDRNFVALELVSQGADYVRYAIPARLNGEEVDILVHYDDEAATFEVLGAWRGINESSGMPDKDLIKIRPGDEVVPLYYYYDENTEDEGYTEGEPIIVGETIELVYDWLPNGSYLYGFSLVDYSGNETFSEFIEFELLD